MILVALPEGLSLAVNILILLSVKKLLRDSNFIRTLSVTEKMGGINEICTDSTGTLTKN